MKIIKHAFEKFDERMFTPEMAGKRKNYGIQSNGKT